jgi:type IV pilus assembly protein PilW
MNRKAHIISISHVRQAGFTLVEIMVAITISLILTAGVIQLFLSNRTSHNVQSGMGKLQENARFALDILSTNLGKAGYQLSSITDTPAKLDLANTLDNATPNATLGFTAGTATASDTISVQSRSATDCLGNATGMNAITTDRYYLNGTNLMCLGSGGGAAETLVEGVENMQILYGEDTDGDGIANRYVNAGGLNAANVNNIVGARIAMLVSTVDNINQNAAATYTLLNIPSVGPFNDGRLRRVFTRTILLRNRI